jgi:zinc D-Ala-D-Ala carboxypeptidase
MSNTLTIPDVHRMTSAELSSWRERWPNFAPSELSSWHGELVVHIPALDALQALRTRWGKPMTINSAYRNPAHNAAVGGAKRSQHKLGRAFDIHIRHKTERNRLEALSRQIGFKGIGRYNTFLHVDLRDGRAATWGA